MNTPPTVSIHLDGQALELPGDDDMCRAFLRLAWEAAAGNRWGDHLLMRLNLGRLT